MRNEFTVGERTIVINGGDPLPGCPESRDDAQAWQDAANKGKRYGEPSWAWDCGFKLDFDGPLIDISSRFYPPKNHYGPKWDGAVVVRVLGKETERREFEAESLDQLKLEVEAYVRERVEALCACLDSGPADE